MNTHIHVRHICIPRQGLPWCLSGKEPTCQCRRYRFDAWVRKIPWRRKLQPTPEYLLGKCHGQRSLEGCSPWDQKWVRHNLVTKQQQYIHTLPDSSVCEIFQARILEWVAISFLDTHTYTQTLIPESFESKLSQETNVNTTILSHF